MKLSAALTLAMAVGVAGVSAAAVGEGATPFSLTGYALTDGPSLAAIERDAARLTSVAVHGAQIGSDGVSLRLPGKTALAAAHRRGAAADLVVTNVDPTRRRVAGAAAGRLLGAAPRRLSVANAIARTVIDQGWDGVVVDLEGLSAADRAGLVAFVGAIRTALPRNRRVTVTVPAFDRANAPARRAYDVAAIGKVADGVLVKGYTIRGAQGGAAPIGGLPWVQRSVSVIAREVPAKKLALGIGAFGVVFARSGRTRYVTIDAARRMVGQSGRKPLWDAGQGEWTARLKNGDVLWWSDERSVAARVALARRVTPGGAGIWRLGVAPVLNAAVVGGRVGRRPIAPAVQVSAPAPGAATPPGGSTPPSNVPPPAPSDTIAPTVFLTGPTAESYVSGVTTPSASATDDRGVVGVQFRLDGVNLGGEDTSAPYDAQWNTVASSNGTHSLTAVARDAAGNTSTAFKIKVVVANGGPPPTAPDEIVPNGSAETPASLLLPTAWANGRDGTNAGVFSYDTGNAHSGSRSLRTTITSFTSGDAKWSFTPRPVTPGTRYAFSDWYRSDVTTEVLAAVKVGPTTMYVYIGAASPSPVEWSRFSGSFVAPAGAETVTILHTIAKVGTLTVDDYSLRPQPVARFQQPLISLTFDDGWRSQYVNALPLLDEFGFRSTQYINTGALSTPSRVTPEMVLDMHNRGYQIGAHSISHPDLTQLDAATVERELTTSKSVLEGIIGVPVVDFASPFGAYNTPMLAAVQRYFRSHRSVDAGYNTEDGFRPTLIVTQNILRTTTATDVQSWITAAKASNAWLVLVYHQVEEGGVDPGAFGTTAPMLRSQLDVIKASGVPVVTVAQALAELEPQRT